MLWADIVSSKIIALFKFDYKEDKCQELLSVLGQFFLSDTVDNQDFSAILKSLQESD